VWTGEPAVLCAWCRTPFGDGCVRRRGRVECAACGSATTDPVPDAESLDAAYGSWYWPDSGRRFSLVGDALLRRSRASMARRIDEAAPAGRILDVGAGEGTLIDALAARGRSAEGLERSSTHPRIRDLEISEVEGEFAAVIFWHSLEHLAEPRRAVRDAAALLAPGGLLVIAVPDYGSLQSRAFGDAWLHLDLPRHLAHLDSASLTSGLESDGLGVAAVSRTRAGQELIGWLDGLVGLLPGRLDLYQSLRRRSARRIEIGPGRRAASVVAGVILFPLALGCAAVEFASGRTGTVYVEARND
jgi:SAM-dependent methyltransferase